MEKTDEISCGEQLISNSIRSLMSLNNYLRAIEKENEELKKEKFEREKVVEVVEEVDPMLPTTFLRSK